MDAGERGACCRSRAALRARARARSGIPEREGESRAGAADAGAEVIVVGRTRRDDDYTIRAATVMERFLLRDRTHAATRPSAGTPGRSAARRRALAQPCKGSCRPPAPRHVPLP